MTRPVVLSCGDPAGVGLELALKARARLGADLPIVLIADRNHIAAQKSDTPVVEITDLAQTHDAMQAGLPLLHHGFPAPATPGVGAPQNAQTVIDVIARGVELAQSGRAAALCTLPINKKLLQVGAGFEFAGHTEYLASLLGSPRSVMMLAAPGLRVVPVTIHIALRDVPTVLSPALLEETLLITHAALQSDFDLSAPRIAVAGLNPHAGEGGMMGTEDAEIIAPVLARLRLKGMSIAGPLSADTMFHAKARETYDVAVCMYHDQALIPLKTLAFSNGTNVTLGLPIVRTSPDHGTAFDIAGRGIADPGSVVAAIRMAADMARVRAR